MAGIKEYTLKILLYKDHYNGLGLFDENLNLVKKYSTTDPVLDWHLFMLLDKSLNQGVIVKIDFYYDELLSLLGNDYHFMGVDSNGNFTWDEGRINFRVLVNHNIKNLSDLKSYYKKTLRLLKLKEILL